jgi:hypothetical protein
MSDHLAGNRRKGEVALGSGVGQRSVTARSGSTGPAAQHAIRGRGPAPSWLTCECRGARAATQWRKKETERKKKKEHVMATPLIRRLEVDRHPLRPCCRRPALALLVLGLPRQILDLRRWPAAATVVRHGAVASDFLSRGAVTPDRLRQAAMALAVGRTAMGVTALAAPSLIWRPWVGDTRGVPAQVLGRALGDRDLALGLGTLAALRAVPPASAAAGTSAGPAAKTAGAWVGFAAVADSLDLVTTAAAWDELPTVGRWLIATTAGGAAVVGAVAAWSLSTQTADNGS